MYLRRVILEESKISEPFCQIRQRFLLTLCFYDISSRSYKHILIYSLSTYKVFLRNLLLDFNAIQYQASFASLTSRDFANISPERFPLSQFHAEGGPVPLLRLSCHQKKDERNRSVNRRPP